MSYSPAQLIEISSKYADLAVSSLVSEAKKKKLDPKAKVRNRGTVCVPAENAKDKKDHFPINDEGQARNALARVQQLSSAPWYKGSLEGLKALVARKVKSKYPGIDVGGKKKEKKSELDYMLSAFASEIIVKTGANEFQNAVENFRKNVQQYTDHILENNPNQQWADQVNQQLSNFSAFDPKATIATARQIATLFYENGQSQIGALLGSRADNLQNVYDAFGGPKLQNKQLAGPTLPASEVTITGDPVTKSAPINKNIWNAQSILVQNPKYRALMGNFGPKHNGVDGQMGSFTRAALKAWKEDNRMPEATDALAIFYINNPAQNPQSIPVRTAPF